MRSRMNVTLANSLLQISVYVVHVADRGHGYQRVAERLMPALAERGGEQREPKPVLPVKVQVWSISDRLGNVAEHTCTYPMLGGF